GERCDWSTGSDHVDLTSNKFGGNCGQLIVLTFCRTEFDGHIATIDIAGLTQTILERSDELVIFLNGRVHKPDHRPSVLLSTPHIIGRDARPPNSLWRSLLPTPHMESLPHRHYRSTARSTC